MGNKDASRSRWLRDRAIANTFEGRPVLTPRPDMPGPASDWPVHQPRAWDAPYPWPPLVRMTENAGNKDAQIREPLTAQDMEALAQIARNFVEANERRHPVYQWPTISERAALDSLRDNIASLDRNRRG